MTIESLKNRSPRDTQAVVCLLTPYLPSVSETFIRAHAEGLPAKVVLVHGWRPAIGDELLLSWPRRAAYKTWRTLVGGGLEGETTAAYLSAFRRTRAQAVLAEYGPTGVLAMDACRRAGIPLVVHFHGYDASERAVLAAHSETYPIMFREAAAIIAVSRAMQRKLVSLGALPEKVHYNPCGIDCEVFEASDPAAAPPVFLAVGRFVEKKGPQLTLKAFAEVYEAYPSARLRMIGDGPLLEECRALVLKLRINEAVTFTGAQPHTVVRREMQSARCFVQHSLEAPNGDCEGTPVGILEACASALPVVSTRHAGIPDVIVEGETGLLVDERDTKGMAEQMLSLARDAELARRLGLAARQHVAAHFSQAQSLDRLWTIISSAIGAGTRTEVEASTVAVT